MSFFARKDGGPLSKIEGEGPNTTKRLSKKCLNRLVQFRMLTGFTQVCACRMTVQICRAAQQVLAAGLGHGKRGQIHRKGPRVSDTDSFIEEVTEEVRRDRLFGLMKKYGWIPILVVVLIVGGAAYNEWRKAQDVAAAQGLGDGIITALTAGDADARATALAAVEAGDPAARALLAMLQAAELNEAGDGAGALALLDGVASNGEIPQIYRQVASFKSLLVQGDALSLDERRTRLEGLSQTVPALRLAALEQLALVEIQAGQTEAAVDRLQRIIADAEVTQDLRRRASQLIVALGGQLQSAEQANN